MVNTAKPTKRAVNYESVRLHVLYYEMYDKIVLGPKARSLFLQQNSNRRHESHLKLFNTKALFDDNIDVSFKERIKQRIGRCRGKRVAVRKVIVCDGEKQLRATHICHCVCLFGEIRGRFCLLCCRGLHWQVAVAGGHGKVSMKRTPMCLREQYFQGRP